ncbi:mRNA 3'-end-processing protein RNA14 [Smittium culicis]|uniref:mRNA 3'-end-processing protein RNA14 n=1 Tax=Smittium culicis TaxID=133412 RepID=A0A1R1XXH8_9FUNG|nr:mRNA 3'-end-processing protein RNA14 [Smittium culicis]
MEASQYLWKINKKNEAITKLNEAIELLPNNTSVYFQLAEFEELNNNFESCHNLFKKLISFTESSIESKRKKILSTIDLVDSELEKLSLPNSKPNINTIPDNAENNAVSKSWEDNFKSLLLTDLGPGFELDLDFEFKQNKSESRDEILSQSLLFKKRKLEHLKVSITAQTQNNLSVERGIHSQVWIAYLRFSMRTQGIDGARLVFKNARTGSIDNLTYHVFVASVFSPKLLIKFNFVTVISLYVFIKLAMIEYHVTKNSTIAGRLFELGLKYFGSEPKFVAEYMKYLININDDTSEPTPEGIQSNSAENSNPKEVQNHSLPQPTRNQVTSIPVENEVMLTSDELTNIKVGSIKNGKFINRSVLLSSVRGSKAYKPKISLWSSYKPSIVPNNTNPAWNFNKPNSFDNTFSNDGLNKLSDENSIGNSPSIFVPGRPYTNFDRNKTDSVVGSLSSLDRNADGFISKGDILSYLYNKIKELPASLIPILENNDLLDAILNASAIQPSKIQSMLVSSLSSINPLTSPSYSNSQFNQSQNNSYGAQNSFIQNSNNPNVYLSDQSPFYQSNSTVPQLPSSDEPTQLDRNTLASRNSENQNSMNGYIHNTSGQFPNRNPQFSGQAKFSNRDHGINFSGNNLNGSPYMDSASNNQAFANKPNQEKNQYFRPPNSSNVGVGTGAGNTNINPSTANTGSGYQNQYQGDGSMKSNGPGLDSQYNQNSFNQYHNTKKRNRFE